MKSLCSDSEQKAAQNCGLQKTQSKQYEPVVPLTLNWEEFYKTTAKERSGHSLLTEFRATDKSGIGGTG